MRGRCTIAQVVDALSTSQPCPGLIPTFLPTTALFYLIVCCCCFSCPWCPFRPENYLRFVHPAEATCRPEAAGQQLEAWTAPLESSWRRLGLWRALGGVLEAPEAVLDSWRVLGASWARWGPFWRRLGRSWGGPGEVEEGVLEAPWSRLWSPGGHVGAI